MPDNTYDRWTFPVGFLWGSATSAHQVEGNNRNDWTEWEGWHSERLLNAALKHWDKWHDERFGMLKTDNFISLID